MSALYISHGVWISPPDECDVSQSHASSRVATDLHGGGVGVGHGASQEQHQRERQHLVLETQLHRENNRRRHVGSAFRQGCRYPVTRLSDWMQKHSCHKHYRLPQDLYKACRLGLHMGHLTFLAKGVEVFKRS